MNLDWPLNCSAAEEFDSRWVSGFCDYAPAPNSASRFMSAYKTLLHNNGLLQELFWITAVFRRSADFSTSKFITATIANHRANKPVFLNIVSECKKCLFLFVAASVKWKASVLLK